MTSLPINSFERLSLYVLGVLLLPSTLAWTWLRRESIYWLPFRDQVSFLWCTFFLGSLFILREKNPQMGTQLLSQVNGLVHKTPAPYFAKPAISLVPSSLSCRVTPGNTKFLGKRFENQLDLRSKRFVIRAQSESEAAPVSEDDGGSQDVPSSSGTSVATLEPPEASAQPVERKPRVKLGEIMGILNKRAIEASENERPIPDIRTGDVVQIKLEVPKNRRRASTYKGMVMSRQNAGIHTTIRIRRLLLESVLKSYSPNIKEIKVVSHRKVRRARLCYLRDKLPRLSTFN
ncbi:50S ribosomal protein L19 [Nymphaea thermarum]|nr:50S ribosomal protein L19 [Nymphaea thermarum]